MGVTQRLYYDDSYLTEFQARVVEATEGKLYLDRTAFYPASGGQPFDIGTIAGVPVVEVVDEGERVAHLTNGPVDAVAVSCQIDWARRFDHMQQHSGQHLLSAVLVETFGAATVSFHLGSGSSTIDVAAAALETQQILQAERRSNEVVFENRPVSVSYEDSPQDLRKPSEREGMLRIVSIEGLDRSACGGTHVRSTGEIGPILIRKLDKVRGNVRIEFLCGLRAVRRARSDFDALARVARVFSVSLEEAPALVAAQLEKLQESEKVRKRLAAELAQARGRELYRASEPDSSGMRRHVRRIADGAIDEELRAEAQSFVQGSRALFVALLENPPAVLLAVSADAEIHAGETLKSALGRLGGRGGGNAQMAQGSVGTKEAVERVWEDLR